MSWLDDAESAQEKEARIMKDFDTFVKKWDPTIRRLLGDLGQKQWGSGLFSKNYTVNGPTVSIRHASWEVTDKPGKRYYSIKFLLLSDDTWSPAFEVTVGTFREPKYIRTNGITEEEIKRLLIALYENGPAWKIDHSGDDGPDTLGYDGLGWG